MTDEVFYVWHRRDRNPSPINAPDSRTAALRYARSKNIQNGANIKVLPARYEERFIANIGIIVTDWEEREN